jgi:N4-gp56 family major capsid protein
VSDAMTTTGSVQMDQTAFDRVAYFALRPELHYDQIADVQPTRQSMPGTVVSFTQIADMTVVTSAISESVDIDAVAISDSAVTVTLVEYGNSVNTTKKLRATSFIEVNPVVANVIGFNAGRSIDSVAEITVRGGSNVRYATGGATDPTARNTVEPDDKLVAADVRRARAELAGANVAPNRGIYYTAFIHPDVTYDLTGETGTASWRDPHAYSQPENIWTAEIGAFEGFTFIETPRAPVFADAGSSTTLTDVYATIMTGQQAIAKGFSSAEGLGPTPRIIMSPIVDKLKRFVPISWYHLVGYARFREAALRRIVSASTIGTNA